MADEVKLKVSADTRKAQAALGDLKQSSEDLGTKLKDALNFGALAAGFSTLASTIGDTVMAFKGAEETSNTLNAVLVNQGIFSDELRGRYDDLATAIQKKTKYGDDDVKAGLAAAQAYVGQMEITQDFTDAVVDFAAAQKMDLVSAFQLVGKAASGETNALGRYGIAVDTTASVSDRLAQVTDGLAEKFGGVAKAQAEGLGAIDQVGEAWGDFVEMIGEVFAPAVAAVAAGLRDVIYWMNEHKAVAVAAAAFLAIGTAIVGVGTALAGVHLAMTTLVPYIMGTLIPSLVAATKAAYAFAASLASNPIVLAVGAIAAAVAGLYLAWKNDFLGIQEVTFGVFEGLKKFFSGFIEFGSELFGGLALIIEGALTGDIAKVKEGLALVRGAIQRHVKDVADAYREGRDRRLEYIETEKRAKETADEEEKKSHEKKEEKKERLTKTQIANVAKAEDEAAKDIKEAQRLRLEREEDYWEYKLKQAQEVPYEESDSTEDALAKIELARDEADLALEALHKIQLDRIAAEELGELTRIEKVKLAEQDHAQKQIELAEKTAEEKAKAEKRGLEKGAKEDPKAKPTDREGRPPVVASIAGLDESETIAYFELNRRKNEEGKLDAEGNKIALTFDEEAKRIWLNTKHFIADNYESIKAVAASAKGFVDGVVTAGQAMKDFFGGNFIASLNGFMKDFAGIPGQLLGNFEELGTLLEGAPAEYDETGTKIIKQEVKPLADQMLAAVDKLLERVPKIVDSFVEKFPKLINQFADAAPKIVRTLLDALPKIMQTIADTAPTIARVFMRAVTSLVKSLPDILGPIIESIPDVLEAFMQEMPRLIEVLFEMLPKLFRMIFDMIPRLVEVFSDNIAPIVSELIEGIIGAVADIVVALIDSFLLDGGLERVVGAILRMIPRLVVAIFEGIWEGLLKAKDAFAELFGEIWFKAGTNFEKLGGGIQMGAAIFMGWLNSFVEWVQTAGEKAKEWLSRQTTAAVVAAVISGMNTIGERKDQLRDFGAKVWVGLKDGLADFVAKVKEAFSNFFSGLGQGFKDAFSGLGEVFKELGGKIATGFQNAVGAVGGGGGGGGNPLAALDPSGWKSVGGLVGKPAYASVGTFVPMIPRGSDIYPHMLAEGEAVINARSVAANPQLVGRLQSSAGPLDAQRIEVVLRGGDEFGRLVAKELVRGSSLGISPIRFSYGGGS